MKVIEIEIPGKPAPMQEVQFNRKTGAVYRTSEYKNNVARINNVCQEHLDENNLPKPFFLPDEPLLLSVEFTFEFTTDHFVSGDKKNPLKDNPPHWYMKKKDIDNMMKPLKDGMAGALYEDDSQVCRYGQIDKVWGYEPSTLVRLHPLSYL